MSRLPRRPRRWAGRMLRAAGLRRPLPPPASPAPPPATPRAPARPPAYVCPETIDLSPYAVDADEQRAAAVRAAAFGHGYLVRSDASRPLPGFLATWPARTVGPLEVRTAPRTVVTVAHAQDPRVQAPAPDADAVVLLGHPVDVDAGEIDPGRIAGRLLTTLGGRGPDQVVREAAYLSGRWTLLVLHRGELLVVPDALASQPVHYADGHGAVTLGSSETLVALARGLQPDQGTADLMNLARRVRPQGVLYLPGTTSWFPGVRQVVPNCLLRVTLRTGATRHERFWPFEPRVEDLDVPRVHAAFRERMQAQVELMCRLGPVAWSLTAGLDSRVTLAHRPRPTPEGLFTFTYLNPGDAPRGAAGDVYGANLVSYRLHIPHRVLHWRRAAPGSVFHQVLRATNPVHIPSHGAAHVMWADLPHDIVEIQSNGGEIGTWYPAYRGPEPLTPHKAAMVWLGERLGARTDFDECFERYLDHAQMADDRLLGYDHHDLLYWEHRMGRWGCTKFLDGDYSHRQMVPFNDRGVIEIMHRLPLEQRRAKVLYALTLAGQPELALPDRW